MRHPLAARVEWWPEEARFELREREGMLADSRLDPAGAVAIVRRSWLAWDGWPDSTPTARPER